MITLYIGKVTLECGVVVTVPVKARNIFQASQILGRDWRCIMKPVSK